MYIHVYIHQEDKCPYEDHMSGFYNGTFCYIQFQSFHINKLQKSFHTIGYFGNININTYLDRRYMDALNIKINS